MLAMIPSASRIKTKLDFGKGFALNSKTDKNREKRFQKSNGISAYDYQQPTDAGEEPINWTVKIHTFDKQRK
jgi:hypothetical protein